MGTPGAQQTTAADAASAALVERLAPLGDVTRKPMFGGFGVFVPAGMFALVTASGVPHFKTDADSCAAYEDAGAERFSRMPYHEIPEAVLADDTLLVAWARTASSLATRRGAR